MSRGSKREQESSLGERRGGGSWTEKHFSETSSGPHRPIVTRFATGVVNVVFAPAWLILWLQTRHQVNHGDWGIDPTETASSPTVDEVYARAKQKYEVSTLTSGGKSPDVIEGLESLPTVEQEGIKEIYRYMD